MIYLIVILFVYLFSPLCKKKLFFSENGLSLKKDGIQGKLVYFYIFTFILVFICGFRSVKIGLDTPQYYFLFDHANKFNSLLAYFAELKKDPEHAEWGYNIYQWVLSFFNNYYFFLFVTAVITITPLMWLIYKYSKIPWLSITLFILFGYFVFYMSGLRQSIALSFCFLAFHYSLENKFSKYLICIFTAFLFHQTALVFLPIYWIKKIPLNNRVLVATIALIGLSFLIRDYVYGLILSVARMDYSEHTSAGGIRMYITMVLVVVLGFVWMKKIQTSELNRSLFYMMIISAILWPVLSIGSPALYRLYYYFHIFVILFSANLAMSVKTKVQRSIVILFFLFIGSAYFLTQVVNGELNVYPYKFNWEETINLGTLRHSWEEM